VVIDVPEPTRVLLISGSNPATPASNALAEDTSGAGGSVRYIAAALTPFKSARRNRPDSCVVDLATVDQWTGAVVQLVPPRPGGRKPDTSTPQEQRLSAYQVVVLTEIEQLTDAQVAALERFVAEGGGLLIIPGEQMRTEELNTALFKDGAGILPAALGMATSSDWTDQTTLLGFDATHPILRFLGGKADALLPVTIGRYFAVDRFATGARSLVRYATGDPMLIESPPASGRRGKVLLLTTSPDADWSTLHREAAFVPLMQSAALYLREGTPRKLNLLPGEAIELALDESAEGRMIRVRVPDSTEERQPELTRSGAQWVARFAETETPGLYQVRLADLRRTQVVQVMVTPSREESNLAALSAIDWKRLERIVDAQRLDPATTGISAATALPAPLELWPVAIGLVFLLGTLEMKMARAMARTEKNE
jgi:hypothetical protein